jgi:hypothetical protein
MCGVEFEDCQRSLLCVYALLDYATLNGLKCVNEASLKDCRKTNSAAIRVHKRTYHAVLSEAPAQLLLINKPAGKMQNTLSLFQRG